VTSPTIRLSVSDDIIGWFDVIGPYLFYAAVFGLVFAGTGLFIGAFIPFITGDSLVFAAGLVAAAHQDSINIFAMVIGVGIAAWLGDQVGYTLGRHFGRPYLDKRQGKWLKRAIVRSDQFYERYGWWSIVVASYHSGACWNQQDELLQVLQRQCRWCDALGLRAHSCRVSHLFDSSSSISGLCDCNCRDHHERDCRRPNLAREPGLVRNN
jgi:hypothetical protein